MKTHDVPCITCNNNEPADRPLALRVKFKSDSEATLYQEVELLMSVLDEVIAEMQMLAESEAIPEESRDISSPS